MSAMVADNGSEMSLNQRLVYNLFHECRENEGLNIDTACLSLKSQIAPDETRFVTYCLRVCPFKNLQLGKLSNG